MYICIYVCVCVYIYIYIYIYGSLLVLSAEILQITYYKLFDHSSPLIFVHKTELWYEIHYTIVEFEIVSRLAVSMCSAMLVLPSRG